MIVNLRKLVRAFVEWLEHTRFGCSQYGRRICYKFRDWFGLGPPFVDILAARFDRIFCEEYNNSDFIEEYNNSDFIDLPYDENISPMKFAQGIEIEFLEESKG